MLRCVRFSNRSQKTAKCGKNISDTLFLLLPHFDVICDLLLNRRTAAWNLFVKLFHQVKSRITQAWGQFLEAPGNYRAPLSCFVFHSRGSFKRFEKCTVTLSATETKRTLSEVRSRPTFLETLISKSDSGPVKLPGLSRNGPLVTRQDATPTNINKS